MCIKRIEYVDHDQFVTFNDEISQAFALTLLCRSYLSYGGKITSYSNNTLVVEVFYLRPEKMVLSGNNESMAPFCRVVKAIGVRSKFAPRVLDQNQDAISIALNGLAQAHSGSQTALRALLAGAAITDVAEVNAMTALGIEDALAVYNIQQLSPARDKLSVLETCKLVSIISEHLSFALVSAKDPTVKVMDLIHFAMMRELPLMPWLTTLTEALIRNCDLKVFLAQYPMQSNNDAIAA